MIGVWNHERRTGEDCLVLNVWTPQPDEDASRPVLVWLHGGGMAVGSASWPLYDFTNLARNNDVVVVGVNHRLGVLGFLDLSHLGDEFADSGNVGMLDIVAALEWVRDNIQQLRWRSVERDDLRRVRRWHQGHVPARHAVGTGSLPQRVRDEWRDPRGARAGARRAPRPTAVLEQLGVGTDVEALCKLDTDAIVQAAARDVGHGSRGGARRLRPDPRPQPSRNIPSTPSVRDRAAT